METNTKMPYELDQFERRFNYKSSFGFQEPKSELIPQTPKIRQMIQPEGQLEDVIPMAPIISILLTSADIKFVQWTCGKFY